MILHPIHRVGRIIAGALALAWLSGSPGPTVWAGASASDTTLPELELGRTAEYDYDPPLAGSYRLPVLQPARDGLVLDAEGRRVRLHELLDGRIAVLSFIYTRCTDPRACLRATGVLNQLQRLSREDPALADKLTLITLSFDPGYDTPEVMSRYGRVFRSDEGGVDWLFLTTRNADELRPLLEAYGQRVDRRKKPSVTGPYYHPLRVYLIDTDRQVRNIYSFGLLDPRLVMTDVRTLLLEREAAASPAGLPPGPIQLPIEELERTDAMDGVGSVEELDVGAIGDAQPGVEAADLGVFVRHPFVGRHAVPVTAFDHERAGRDEGGHFGVVKRGAEVELGHLIFVGEEVAVG
jgi:cytochrome oxidase Cu insertion factor (SCO1/SenC/PrrC family)